MALPCSLAQPPAPSLPRFLTHHPSALASLPVSPGRHLRQSLSLSPQLLRTRRSTRHSSTFALLKPEEGFMQADEKEEDLIGAIEVELASIETCLMDAAALFEALMLVDLMERLGIQRYFEHQIRRILRTSYMQWDDKYGLNDAKTTVLAFRLLRLHGYPVSAGVLMALGEGKRSFYECFSVDSPTNISAMLNLYRCSQTGFPSESKIMGEAQEFARSQLLNVLSEGNPTLLQPNNLGMEVNFALELPHRRLMPRLESRSLIKQLWPGNESTRKYLKLAKLDLQKLQKLYQRELEELESFCRWWQRFGFDEVKCGRKRLGQSYFVVAPTIYEPQFSSFRLAYAKGAVLITILDDLFDDKSNDLQELRRLNETFTRWDSSLINDLPQHKLVFEGIDGTYLELAAEANRVQGRDILPIFKHMWAECAACFLKEAEWMHSERIPTYEEYMQCTKVSIGAKIITWTSAFLLGEKITDEMLRHIGPDSRFTDLVSVVCRLSNDLASSSRELEEGKLTTGVGCYMRDHPGCTQEEAVVGLANVIELACQELEWELYRSRAVVPEFCSRAVLSNARGARLLYRRMDGLTNSDEEFMKLFQDFMFNPLE
ncbi:bifunctional levopimaradiene synthase, chloroplastic-like isoform X1 [Phoenix dactylifera]|uniref:Bifunctional levopimaradiene synthase, chloroplastic-like isoform X1 n=1 Tax=Phoenix dactylifera TaxID=42345 RepID=A0A8B8ZI32_PHODC|nr:bifunctional levopimaradiene synthase, chloroplastic-like isoform X1 [Phoenix dactylifera]